MNNPPLLQAKKLSKTFFDPQPLPILKEVSLELHAGESVAIMGASGEGKTTLLHIFGTLELPTSGDLSILGEPVSAMNAARIRSNCIGFVFQAFHLLESFSPFENILMPCRVARKDCSPGSPAYQQAQQLLEEVGLSERRDTPVTQLSGGEKQRVAIARALCNAAPILMADEPTGNLDNANSLRIQELLFTTTKKREKGLIIVTHDMELAKRCDHRYRLSDGILRSE